MKKRIRAYIIAITALFMAGCAAFFSVTGVGQLAAGAGISVILLVSALEIGKLVIASFAHRRWNHIGWLQKSFAVFGVAIAMLITSIGIFGQLIGGYTSTSADYQIGTQQIQLKETEKEVANNKIVRFDEQVVRKEKRADELNDLRTQQENRIDSLQVRNAWQSAREAKALIQETNKEIQILNSEIDSLNSLITLTYEDISKIDSTIIFMKGDLFQGKAAPLKMIADMAGVDMDTATKSFFGFFVLIFDPFAILLVIFFNVEMATVRREEEEERRKTEPEEPEVPVLYKSNPDGDFIQHYNDIKSEEPEIDEEEPEVDEEEPEIDEEEPEIDEEESIQQQMEGVVEEEEISEGTSTIYNRLLDVLYINGQVQPGENLYTFKDFIMAIENKGLNIEEKVIIDFLKVCVMLKIINVDKYNRKAIMSHQDAKAVISQLKD